MEQISKYKAIDGSIFNTEQECLSYEALIEKVKSIMRPLGERPDDSNFSNGGGYIQHDSRVVSIAKEQIVELAIKTFKIENNVNFYIIGRYCDDCGNKCLSSAWYRLNCCDKNNREWGQGYYAVNPDKGTQKPYHEIKSN